MAEEQQLDLQAPEAEPKESAEPEAPPPAEPTEGSAPTETGSAEGSEQTDQATKAPDVPKGRTKSITVKAVKNIIPITDLLSTFSN